jgi:hypothetical protein
MFPSLTCLGMTLKFEQEHLLQPTLSLLHRALRLEQVLVVQYIRIRL